MKIYTVVFKSGGYFTLYATHFKQINFEPEAGCFSGIRKFVFMKDDRQVAACPFGHVQEIYTLPLFGVEKEVLYEAR